MRLQEKRIIVLCILLISIISFPNLVINLSGAGLKDADPKSSTNYLFKDVNYNITLTDVYDDEDLDKEFTDAYFQTEHFNISELNWQQIHNESADSGVDNTYSKSPSNTSITMINGTYDNSDNMKANDDVYSEFETDSYDIDIGDPEYINSVTYTYGYHKSGTLENTHNDDTYAYVMYNTYQGGLYEISVTLNFSPELNGRDFYISAYIKSWSVTSASLKVNGVNWKAGSIIDFDDELKEDVNSITFYAYSGTSTLETAIYYFKLEEIASTDAELEFTADIDFSSLNPSELLVMNVYSHHYTNVSTTIIGEIYDYNSGTYTQMFSSSNTVETENTFSDNSSVNYYLNGSGNLRLRFRGTNDASNFKLFIDYIEVQFYYKMDLWHEVSFNMTGLWRYRWEIHGSLQYTDWTNFEVVDPEPNFHAISESEYITRWILQGADISAVEDFHDDISGSNWDLYGVSNRIMNITNIPTDDAEVLSSAPDNNYGSNDYMYLYYDLGNGDIRRVFIKYEYSYLDLNYTSNSSLYYYSNWNEDGYACVYHTTDFDESTITWNNQPVAGTYQREWAGATGWQEEDIGAPNKYYMIRTPEDIDRLLRIYTSESSYKPQLRHHLSKNYIGSGYMYMQTNTTELIALKSTDYGTHYNLSSGDYFEVDFQTSSDSQINLILLKDGVINKTLTLSQSGNTNFNRHTVQLSVDEDVEFDQLKISSTFEDTDYVKVYDIKTKKYTLTGDYADFYIGSHNQRDVYLTPDTYNLRIFEEGTKKIDENITIGSTDYYYVYSSTETIQCRITLFSLDGDYLQFEDYHIKVNRSLGGEYNEFWLVDTIFYADEETYAYIEVYDRFDSSIANFTRLVSSYIDLELAVYKLQIKNLMEQKTTVDINTTHVYPLLSGESLYFMLVKKYYQIGYYNESNDYNQFIVYLDSNEAYELNTSYFSVYFSLFDQNSHRLDDSLFSLYLNSSRKDFGFIELHTKTYNIIVYDWLNKTVYNETEVDLDGYAEYNIFVTVFELQIRHLGYENSNITLCETTTHSGLNFSMAPDTLRSFMLANSTYNVTWVNGEDGSSTTYDITLNVDYILTLDTSYFDVYFGLFTYDGLGIDHDTVRFYINNERKDFGFNNLKQNTNTLTVLDFFNHTLFNKAVDLSGYSEYNIFVTIYTLFLYNNYTFPIDIVIERNNIEVRCSLAPQMFTQYRFVPNVEYYIIWYYENGTRIDDMELEFEENGQIVSFGFYEEEMPFDPEPIINSFNNILILIFFFVGILLILTGIVLYLKKKNRELQERDKYFNHKLKPTSYSRNLTD